MAAASAPAHCDGTDDDDNILHAHLFLRDGAKCQEVCLGHECAWARRREGPPAGTMAITALQLTSAVRLLEKLTLRSAGNVDELDLGPRFPDRYTFGDNTIVFAVAEETVDAWARASTADDDDEVHAAIAAGVQWPAESALCWDSSLALNALVRTALGLAGAEKATAAEGAVRPPFDAYTTLRFDITGGVSFRGAFYDRITGPLGRPGDLRSQQQELDAMVAHLPADDCTTVSVVVVVGLPVWCLPAVNTVLQTDDESSLAAGPPQARLRPLAYATCTAFFSGRNTSALHLFADDHWHTVALADIWQTLKAGGRQVLEYQVPEQQQQDADKKEPTTATLGAVAANVHWSLRCATFTAAAAAAESDSCATPEQVWNRPRCTRSRAWPYSGMADNEDGPACSVLDPIGIIQVGIGLGWQPAAAAAAADRVDL